MKEGRRRPKPDYGVGGLEGLRRRKK